MTMMKKEKEKEKKENLDGVDGSSLFLKVEPVSPVSQRQRHLQQLFLLLLLLLLLLHLHLHLHLLGFIHIFMAAATPTRAKSMQTGEWGRNINRVASTGCHCGALGWACDWWRLYEPAR